MNDEHVGLLAQDDSGLISFQYGAAWLKKPAAIPLSASLPLQDEPFKGNRARPFFAGILPEEDPRARIAAILGVSERNDFALLERIGGECAGAICLLPEGDPAPDSFAGGARNLSEIELQKIIAELPRRPLLAGEEGIRLSLAGAQPKLPVIIHESTVALPLGATPSTHIIKPEPERFPGLVANEFLCMTLARLIGFNVPPISIRIIGDKPCIVVQRFDRQINQSGKTVRVHQEDFCQALGFPPERKYQQEGGPLLRDCISLLNRWSTIPALDVLSFLKGLIFNVLIGNADAHAKNYSMIYTEDQRRLAPLYDLVCTLAWPELSKVPAMKIGKSASIETVTPAHWQKMAEEVRVGWPMLRKTIGEISRQTLVGLNDDALSRAVKDSPTGEKVARIIEQRARSFAKEFE